MIYFNFKAHRTGGLGDFVHRICRLSKWIEEKFGDRAKLCVRAEDVNIGHTDSREERMHLLSYLSLDERFPYPENQPPVTITVDKINKFGMVINDVVDGDVVEILDFKPKANVPKSDLFDLSHLRDKNGAKKSAVLHLRRSDIAIMKSYGLYFDPITGFDSNTPDEVIKEVVSPGFGKLFHKLKNIADPFTKCNFQRLLTMPIRVLFPRLVAVDIANRLKEVHGFDEVIIISDGIEGMFPKTLAGPHAVIDRVKIHTKMKDLKNLPVIDRVIMKGDRDDFRDTSNVLINADLVVTIMDSSITILSTMAGVPTLSITRNGTVDFSTNALMVDRFDKEVNNLV